ncbi:carboxylating nicotinate-nucleotide diphosphorylase [Desulfocurvus sp. DL9XJH121]
MNSKPFAAFFSEPRLAFVRESITRALAEDGRDLTSDALFPPGERAEAVIVAKEPTLVAGLALAPLILDQVEPGASEGAELLAAEGSEAAVGDVVARFSGSARTLLTAERIILNYLSHLSGIANLTRSYARLLAGSRTRLLDTRKTLPGLRYLEKYAVLMGGGENHRMDLAEMLMLKDNHIDRAGGIAPAVAALRAAYSPCPPIEVECRTVDEVRQAVQARVQRIMLDNMPPSELAAVLALVPEGIETEISGGVNLTNIAEIAAAGADFVSVGRLTHSAPAADFSMRIATREKS